jgi:hypothetical protein
LSRESGIGTIEAGIERTEEPTTSEPSWNKNASLLPIFFLGNIPQLSSRTGINILESRASVTDN